MDARETDEQIAWRLAQSNYSRITREMVLVWRRSKKGAGTETIMSIRKDYPDESRPGRDGLMAGSTLYEWVHKVNKAIKDARLIESDPREPEETDPFRLTLAHGSEVYTADDPTPKGREPDKASSWQTERMKSEGVIDRYSRKRSA